MRNLARHAFVFFFISAGINHFVNPSFYLKIIPPFLPAHELINALSGAAEMVIGILIAMPRTRAIGGWAAIALLVAVFPANLYLFAHQELIPAVPPLLHLLRLPLQALFIAWAYFAAGLGQTRSKP